MSAENVDAQLQGFMTKADKDAYDTLVANLKSYLAMERDEAYTALKRKIHNNSKSYKFRASVPDAYKKGVILRCYVKTLHMTYGDRTEYDHPSGIGPYDDGHFYQTFLHILKGDFRGRCEYSAKSVATIARGAGFNSIVFSCDYEGHGWCMVESDDNNGKFWMAIPGTSYAYNAPWGIEKQGVIDRQFDALGSTDYQMDMDPMTYAYAPVLLDNNGNAEELSKKVNS